MTVAAPRRTGILERLAARLPQEPMPGVFRPTGTALNFITKCNAKCTMCLEAGRLGQPSMDYAAADDILTQVDRLGKWEVKRFLHLWGGEPFLATELLGRIVGRARELNFGGVEIVTNGFWGKDEAEAKNRLQAITRQAGDTPLRLELSCDDYHQEQPVLPVTALTNIVSVVAREFPHIRLAVNCIPTRENSALESFIQGLASRGFYVTMSNNEGAGMKRCSLVSGSTRVNIPIALLVPTLSGRCSTWMKEKWPYAGVDPKHIPQLAHSIDQSLAFNHAGEMFMNIFFQGNGVLPMGKIGQFGLPGLIGRVEADPIAISLIMHGYSEIYPHLKALEGFDCDAWARQFISYYDILQGLEQDRPFFPSG